MTFQSTLPRGERLYRSGVLFVVEFISIHAPTRGATRHTTATDGLDRDFNPRSHEGSDAPRSIQVFLSCRFQSTLPRGERPKNGRTLFPPDNFNPRSHEGSDEFHDGRYGGPGDFNPRSHEGSDSSSAVQPKLQTQFQSTLPRGERLCPNSVSESAYQFQSTLPRGERLHKAKQDRKGVAFQSTLPRGERPNSDINT